MVTSLFIAVVEHHVKTSRQRDYQLLLLMKGMAETFLAARHIVDPLCATYVKRQRFTIFDKR